jgi:hypothetical protein
MKKKFILFLFIFGCDQSVKLSRSEIYNMAINWQKKEYIKEGFTTREEINKEKIYRPKFRIIYPKEVFDKVTCGGLGNPQGCIDPPMRAMVSLVDFIAIEFSTREEALEYARNIDGYYIHNWAFDDVKGEPVLEGFVEAAFKGIQATPDEK